MKNIISWDDPLFVNFHLTNVIIVLISMVLSTSNVLNDLVKSLYSSKSMIVFLVVQIYALPYFGNMEESFKKYKDSSVLTFFLTYLLQISKRLFNRAEYVQLVNELKKMYHVDERYEFYPSVGCLFDKNGNIKTDSPDVDTNLKFNYGSTIRIIKEHMKKLPKNDPNRATCTKSILILHELSTKNMKNIKDLDIKFLKTILSKDEARELINEIINS